jgi:hypothetical protein
MKKPTGANLALDTAHYDENIIRMMDEATHCLNCGADLKYQPKNKRRNRGYCDMRCLVLKPPKLAYAERQWKKPAKDLIIELLNNHTSQATAELLGVGKPQLYKYIQKFSIRKTVVWK